MPVTIKELIFRAVVSNKSDKDKYYDSEKKDKERDVIIESCVSQVLKILARKNER